MGRGGPESCLRAGRLGGDGGQGQLLTIRSEQLFPISPALSGEPHARGFCSSRSRPRAGMGSTEERCLGNTKTGGWRWQPGLLLTFPIPWGWFVSLLPALQLGPFPSPGWPLPTLLPPRAVTPVSPGETEESQAHQKTPAPKPSRSWYQPRQVAPGPHRLSLRPCNQTGKVTSEFQAGQTQKHVRHSLQA